MITAQRLIAAAQIKPVDLGIYLADSPSFADATREEIDAAEQFALVQKVETEILPGAISEVRVPVFEAASLGFEEGTTALIGAGDDFNLLFDLAVLSYGRSEINKQIDSNSKTYDADSDQDRIQGNDRLKKLIASVNAGALTEGGVGSGATNAAAALLTIELAPTYPCNEFAGYGCGGWG